MKTFNASIIGIAFLLLACCVPQQFYTKSNLNRLSLGQTKEQILALFPPARGVPGMEMRAAQRSGNGNLVEKEAGRLLEVGEVLLSDGVTPTVSYWFMFEDGKLVQWGRPEDWNKAAERYNISFNPSPGVTPR